MCEKVRVEPRRLAREREKWTNYWSTKIEKNNNQLEQQTNQCCLRKYEYHDKSQDAKMDTQSRAKVLYYSLITSWNYVIALSVLTTISRLVNLPTVFHRPRTNPNEARRLSSKLKYETSIKLSIKKTSGKSTEDEPRFRLGTTHDTPGTINCIRSRLIMEGPASNIMARTICVTLLISLLMGPITRLNHQVVEASLIIGDSAIEIQEMDGRPPELGNQVMDIGSGSGDGNNLILGKASGGGDAGQQSNSILSQADSLLSSSAKDQTQLNQNNNNNNNNNRVSGPLPPILSPNSNGGGDSDGPDSLRDVISKGDNSGPGGDDRSISGRVVDFELTPAGGHNKAKIKKKKKKEKKMAAKEEKKFKKWKKGKKSEKKSKEMKHMEEMKKKKQEGHKGKKKWGKEVHGQKKKGDFKKKKWGKKVKKGKGVKKGKKGKKFLADKGHKNTGFKTVYHKEEWGGSKKWHDIKREKKWDEQSKKWKKKWKKEKGKKYKGDHMKKYEKQKKHGKKYKKEKKEKFKKEKKEEFKKGMKKKKEEHMKKKEGGKKKEMKEEKKKKEAKKKKKKKGR